MKPMSTSKPAMGAKASRNAAPSGKIGSFHKQTDMRPGLTTPVRPGKTSSKTSASKPSAASRAWNAVGISAAVTGRKGK